MTSPTPDTNDDKPLSRYHGMRLDQIILDFGKVRGDLVEQYAREQMRSAILGSAEVKYLRNTMVLAQTNKNKADKRADLAEIQMANFRTQLIQARSQRDSYRTEARVLLLFSVLFALAFGIAMTVLT